MDKLVYTALAFVVGIWVWMEYFRAVPHLEQQGVLNNFQVESVESVQIKATVLKKQFIQPARRTIHPASPVVGSFNDLAYLSNIDVLLSNAPVPSLQGEWGFDDVRRCFTFEGTLDTQQQVWTQQHVQQLSLIAANEAVTNTMRRLRAGQQVTLTGDFVQAQSAKTKKPYAVGVGSEYAAQCRLFRVSQIKIDS